MRQFARDVDLVRGIAGDMTRLGAMAGASGDTAYASLGVQMSGPDGIARPLVGGCRAEATEGAEITLAGARGKAIVDVRAARRALDAGTGDRRTVAEQAVRRLGPGGRLARPVGRAPCDGEPPMPDWVDAARGVELAETIDRSLQKGRTIELYYEDYTEEGTFKGTMTSIGCGLLLLGHVLAGRGGASASKWVCRMCAFGRICWSACLALFLLLQLLMLVFRRPADKSAAEVASETVALGTLAAS